MFRSVEPREGAKKPVLHLFEDGNFDRALREGARLHAFRSGGGLRVVRVQKGDKLIGYGEHPYIEEALRHADEDVAAGGRDYKKVYGEGGLYDHYLTGAADSPSALDRWVVQGRTFDVYFADGVFVAELPSSEVVETPPDLICRVRLTGKPERFTSRGYTYEVSPCDGGWSRSVVAGEDQPGRRSWSWDAMRIGRGVSIGVALAEGLEATPQEVGR